jgi:hypothetical protein
MIVQCKVCRETLSVRVYDAAANKIPPMRVLKQFIDSGWEMVPVDEWVCYLHSSEGPVAKPEPRKPVRVRKHG